MQNGDAHCQSALIQTLRFVLAPAHPLSRLERKEDGVFNSFNGDGEASCPISWLALRALVNADRQPAATGSAQRVLIPYKYMCKIHSHVANAGPDRIEMEAFDAPFHFSNCNFN
ncbi:hypothetical protein V7S43_000241 [Phytophthora oleae]|uniref:Uncharacterized protein n=1 Tax=Phytophthora oleae TaxID=2107226 RepID=A0ABD3G6I0_9STRA